MTYLKPTWSSAPEWHTTLGPEVGEMCAAAGYVPDEGQQAILDATFGMDRQGLPVAFEVGIVAPRQNIKTGAQKMIALGKAFLLERDLLIWSAHETNTSKEAAADLAAIIENNDFLRRQTLKVNLAEGREYIRHRRGRILFKTRTGSGGRGLSGDDVILDEAFALKASHMGALLPVMLTRPHAQIAYGSSAGMLSSSVLRGIRDRGRAGSDRLAYFEYGDPNPRIGCAVEDCDHAITTPGCVLDDRSRWWATNPALGIRINEENLASLRRSLPPEEFARECLGWWDDPSTESSSISSEAWNALSDEYVDARELRPFLAIDVAPNHSSATIVAVAYDQARGVPVLELVERRGGASWLPGRVRELAAQYDATVALNSAGPVGSLLPELSDLPFVDVRGGDYGKACGLLVASVNEGGLRHRGEPEFIAAIVGAKSRKSGDGFTWSRVDSSVDITPLVAATVGLWAAASSPGEADPGIYVI